MSEWILKKFSTSVKELGIDVEEKSEISIGDT
jgi:hypothetical protein